MESIFALLDVTMVSAFAARLMLGQVKVNEKSNEIVAIPTLLHMMAIEGAVIAIDAIGCQLIGKRADYILAITGGKALAGTDRSRHRILRQSRASRI
jgi:predicted transposase YbfD/YdcC